MKSLPRITATILCFYASSALADGPRAALNLFTNMANAGQSLDPANASNTLVAPSLIRGMYILSDSKGGFIGYTNEAGTLFGSSRGFNGIAQGESQFRPLTSKEVSELRSELVVNIDRKKLITVKYGEGKQSLFLFSAIDCPACKVIEEKLSKPGSSENTTFFIIPSTLQGSEAKWQSVSNIWCANDSAFAWKKYWATGATPVSGTCPFHDGHIAQKVNYYLEDILKAVGIAIQGTPTYMREDGILLTKATLNLPLQPAKPSYWLTGVENTDIENYWPHPVAAHVSNAVPDSNKLKKINVGQSFKGLLSK